MEFITKRLITYLFIFGLNASLTLSAFAQMPAMPSKLQIAVEPEEIVLTQGITVGASERTIQMIVREISGVKPAKLDVVAHPFRETNSGDMMDVSVITVNLPQQQTALDPGGLQRVELSFGGFRQAGSYLGAITVHDSVSGERQEIPVRINVKDNPGVPALMLLGAILAAAGVNYWTKKGRRKNRLEQRLNELQETLKLAGSEDAPFLADARQLFDKARVYTQEFRFALAEAAIEAGKQKLETHEQRQRGSAELREKIQGLLNETRELGATDPQASRLSRELIELLPTVETDYDETDAVTRQFEMFLHAYRLARRDAQAAKEKLNADSDAVRHANRAKIEFLLRDVERLLNAAETMNALDDANTLLRNIAFELSPETVNQNIFRAERMQKTLEKCREQAKRITGTQMQRIAQNWLERAESEMRDNRFEDMEETLHLMENALNIIDRIKDAEKRVKGKDQRMTDLRRILRDSKTALERLSRDGVLQAEHEVSQALAMLDNSRKQYEPFTLPESEPAAPFVPPHVEDAGDAVSTQLRPIRREDLEQRVNALLEEAARYPRLLPKIEQWRAAAQKLIRFDELADLNTYLNYIQEELSLYAQILSIRAQAEGKRMRAALRLSDQAAQLLLTETTNDRGVYHRAQVLADAANALLEESGDDRDIEQVLAQLGSPKLATQIVTYGAVASYFVVAATLGFQILYAPNHDFGALPFPDYFSLILWAFGFEGAKITATNVYEAYFKKEG